MTHTRLLLPVLLGSFVTCKVDFDAQLALIAVDRTVVLTQSSCPYLSFTANWIYFIEKLNIQNYLVFAEDEITFDYLNTRHKDHAVFVRELDEEAGEDSADFADFGTEAFRRLTQSRPAFLLRVVQAGYTALWVDSDVVLLQNPLQILPTLYEYVGVDDAPGNDIERASSYICTCLLYLKPTVQVENLLSDWLAECQRHDQPASNDQEAFNAIFHSRHSPDLQYYVMPRRAFPNGESSRSDVSLLHPSSSHAQPYWSHANWIHGSTSKRKHFVDQELWRPPDDLPTNCTPREHMPHDHRLDLKVA